MYLWAEMMSASLVKLHVADSQLATSFLSHTCDCPGYSLASEGILAKGTSYFVWI